MTTSFTVDTRRPADFLAFAVMVLLCATWGIQSVATKWLIPQVSPLMQGAIRSLVACVCVVAYAQVRGICLITRETAWAGLAAGVLFGSEFVFVYAGLTYTSVSHSVVFVYLAPVLTALGLALFLPSERLRTLAWIGIALAFGGVAVAFSEKLGVPSVAGDRMWFGDLLSVISAFLWAATTIVIRATSLSNAPAAQTLFYQLAVSAVILPVASVAVGEPGIIHIDAAALGILAFQGIIVAFLSYLAWFWLLTQYSASRMSVFGFLTPLFGVIGGATFLSEPISATFLSAALLVLLGIVLVNWPARSGS